MSGANPRPRKMAENPILPKVDKCLWVIEDDCDSLWNAGCGGILHQFIGGGPKENYYKFCPYCGREIETEETE